MNALINSQFEEFEKFKANYEESTGSTFPISYGQYTGQQKEEQRVKIRDNPPTATICELQSTSAFSR